MCVCVCVCVCVVLCCGEESFDRESGEEGKSKEGILYCLFTVVNPPQLTECSHMECHADQLQDKSYIYEYLKVCTNVHSLQLGCFGVCDIEIPGTEHLIAKVDFAL